MLNNYQKVYQFKISLKNIKPPIWRRIQVPENYSFWDLHVAIQDAMGWLDYHLHEFNTIESDYRKIKRIGLPNPDMPDLELLPVWKEKIKDWFSLDKTKAINYTYDFGDSWEHRIELEKIINKEKNVNYPICIKGKRACPPEDCGGVWRYENILKILENKKNGKPIKEEYIGETKELVEWLGKDFEPEEFDCSEVYFSDPLQRLEDNNIIENFPDPTHGLPEKNTAQKIEWQLGYFDFKHLLKDENGKKSKAILLVIVHPESYYLIDLHLLPLHADYLKEIINRILELLKNHPLSAKKLSIKNEDLFNALNRLEFLNLLGIELKLDKETKVLNSVKRDAQKFLKF